MTPAHNKVSLLWRAPSSDGGSAITGYRIEHSGDGGLTWEASDVAIGDIAKAGTTYTYSITGLFTGTAYRFRVSARNANGVGVPSAVLTATTSTSLGAPTGLMARANGQTQIDLSWTAPANDGGASVTDYKIEVCAQATAARCDTDSDWSELDAATESTATTYAHTGLTAGTTRHYRVSAINSAGAGLASAVASATTVSAVTPPGAPTGLTARANGQTQIDLSWTAPANDGGRAIVYYSIDVCAQATAAECDTEAEWSRLSLSLITTHAHTGLTAGTTRHYRVLANNGFDSPTSAVASATTTSAAATAPGAPTGLTATARGQTQINLSWTAPAEDGGAAITDYKIEVCAQATAAACDTETEWSELDSATVSTDTTYAHSGLTAGTTRHYRVSAVNSVGTGDASAVASATTAAAVAPPSAQYENHPELWSASLTVGQWTIPFQGHGYGYNSFTSSGALTDVDFTYKGKAFTVSYIGIGTDIVFFGGTPGLVGNLLSSRFNLTLHIGAHTFAIDRAHETSSGEFVFTNPGLSWSVGDTVAMRITTSEPGAPGSLAAAPGAGQVTLSWAAPAKIGGSAITGYQYRRSSDGGTTWSPDWTDIASSATATSHVVTGLTAGTAYTFQLRAVNTQGSGLHSATAMATALAANQAATGAPAITGTAQVGRTLTAGKGTIADGNGVPAESTFGYQWIGVSGATETDIANATAKTYVPVAADVGKTLKVRVSFTDDAGHSEMRTSAAVGPVTAADLTPPPPGTAVWSATLTIGQRKAGTYLYTQFGYDRVRYGLGALSRTGFTHGGRGYTVERLMGGPGGDMRGYRSGLTYGTGSNAKPVNTWTPMLMLGLSAGLGAGGDALVLYFGGHSLALGDAVRSADGSEYAWPRPAGLNWPDGGTVAVRLAAAGGAANRAATGYPALAATAQVGHALEADLGAIADGDGLTSPSWRYQWLVESRPYDGPLRAIEGATGAAYTPVAADEGRWLGVRVSFTDDAGHAESAVSPLRRVRAAPVAPSAANPVWSATLTAERQWEDDYDLRVGYDGDALGALSETGFDHGGNEYAVRRLMMTSEGASDGARALMLHLSRGLGAGGDGLVLHIGARAFALGDAQRSADGREYAWADPGRWTWSDGERALVSLALASGRATQAPLAGFVLFDNAAGGADVAALSPGAVLDGLASERLNIRAEVAPGAEVGSVELALSGRQSASRTENLAPYALFGDRGGQAFPPGSYTLTATPYAEANLGGAPGPALSMTFTVAAADRTAPSVTLTSGARGPVSGEFEVTVAFSEPVSGFRMSELAIVNGQAARMLSAPGGTLHTVTVAPDEGASGEVTVTVPAGVAVDAAGNPNTASETLRIALAPAPLRVTGFTLFDHAAGRDVAALTAGAVLPAQSSDRLNIRAEVAGAAGSVGLALSGRASAAGTENVAPWYLFGDLGNRGARAFPAGTYTVTATPYPQANLGGTAGRALSVTFRVKAHELAVADARAVEGRDETIDFAVTLAPASPAAVTVDYATADGSATAGEDYTAASGTLTFAPGETSKTVAVPVLDDAIDEGEETFTLTLSAASGATIADAEAVGAIVNSDPLQRAWLARFGRTAAEHVLDAVQARLAAPRGAGMQATLAGQGLGGAAHDRTADDGGADGRSYGTGTDGLAAWSDGMRNAPGDDPASRPLTGRDMLTGSAFALTGESAGGVSVALWGRGAHSGFDGREGALALDGTVTTGMLGTDYARGRWLAGLALSHSEGDGTYRMGDVDEGKLASSLTGVYPYARYAVTERLSVWGAAGYGAGTLTVTRKGRPAMKADLSLTMAAAGARGALAPRADAEGFELAVKTDALLVRASSDKTTGMKGEDAGVSRLRLGLDGSWRFALGGGGWLTPSFEAGVRHDGGDAETGLGVDIGGGLAFADPGGGLALELNARALLAHEDDDFRDWGVSGALRYDPDPASERGLTLTLAPSWGASSKGGADALLGRDTLAGLAANDAAPQRGRLGAEAGYGFAAFGGRFTGTPYLGLGLTDEGGRDYRLGWRLGAARADAPDMALALEATRRVRTNDDEPEHGIGLRLTLRW